MSQKVFITGATGYIGSALSERLARVGFEMYGLTRTAERARGLSARGVVPVFGDLKRPETYLAILKNCDAAMGGCAVSSTRAASGCTAIPRERWWTRTPRSTPSSS